MRTSLLPSMLSMMLSGRLGGAAVTTRPDILVAPLRRGAGAGAGAASDAGAGGGGGAGSGGWLVAMCCDMEWLLSPWAVL